MRTPITGRALWLPILILGVTVFSLPLNSAVADNVLESQWLYSLKHAHLDNGDSLPINHSADEDTIQINNQDIKKLLFWNHAQASNSHSQLQFSPLNYQADISENALKVKLFYQF